MAYLKEADPQLFGSLTSISAVMVPVPFEVREVTSSSDTGANTGSSTGGSTQGGASSDGANGPGPAGKPADGVARRCNMNMMWYHTLPLALLDS